MERFELFCRILGWIVIGGCSLCVLFSIIGLFYVLIKKIIMKSTDWDAIAKRCEKSQKALDYMAEHPLTHEDAVEQSKRLRIMVLEDERAKNIYLVCCIIVAIAVTVLAIIFC